MVCAMHVGKNEQKKKIDSSAGCSPGDTRPVPIYYVYINRMHVYIYIYESHGKSLRRSQTHTHALILYYYYSIRYTRRVLTNPKPETRVNKLQRCLVDN